MALIGKYSVLNKNPGRAFGGSTVSDSPAQWGKSGPARGRFYGVQDLAFYEGSGTPNGYTPGYAWVIPQKSGNMASYTQISGSGSISSANLAGGLNALADLIGSGDITSSDLVGLGILNAALSGSGDLTADILALGTILAALSGTSIIDAPIIGAGIITSDLSGFGDITSASMGLVVSMTADLIGSGTLTGDLSAIKEMLAALAGTSSMTADITGAGNITSDLSGSGALVGAIESLGSMVANLTGTGTISADIRALGNMTADLTPFTELSPESLAAAVWNAVAALFDSPGTTGELLGNASSAGDPWSTSLPGSYIAGTAGYIVGNMDEAIEIAQQILDGEDIEVDGLDSITLRQSLRLILASLAGKISGAETSVVTIRDVLDHKDRIVANVDDDGNRLTVTTDVSD